MQTVMESVTQQQEVNNFLITRNEYSYLQKLVLVQILTFNARRGGKPTKLTLDHWINRDKWKRQEDIDNLENATEKVLAERLKVVYTKGKRKKRVLTLFTLVVQECINVLVMARSQVGIGDTNQYLFPWVFKKSENHVRGWDVVNSIAAKAHLKNPKLITSTKIRKQMATVLQLLDMTPDELECVTEHLGHTADVQKTWYRQKVSTIELTKVVTLLMAKDKGVNFKNKRMKDLGAEASDIESQELENPSTNVNENMLSEVDETEAPSAPTAVTEESRNGTQRLREKINEITKYLQDEQECDIDELKRLKKHLEKRHAQFEKDIANFETAVEETEEKSVKKRNMMLEAEDILEDVEHLIGVKKQRQLERKKEREAEEKRLQREAEEKRLEREVAEKRLERAAEEKRMERAAEEKRLKRAAEEKRLKREAEEKRLEREAEEKRLEREAEEKRLQRDAEKKRLERAAEEKRLERAAEYKRLEREAEAKRLVREAEEKRLECEVVAEEKRWEADERERERIYKLEMEKEKLRSEERMLQMKLEMERDSEKAQAVVNLKDMENQQSYKMTLPEHDFYPTPKVPTVRLPKLELQRFGGQPIDKFNYLRAELENEALRVIDGLELTNANYEVALGILHERFGNKQLIINNHYTQLMDSQPASNKTTSLRATYDKIEKHLRSLNSLGEDTNTRSTISLIRMKLPRVVIARLEQKRGEEEEWTVETLRKVLKRYITAQEVADNQYEINPRKD
ncbi:calponin homology domain-containing protein DDB_G0272472-like [Hydractinia symbiolongicarpus]|uniref:calponin homology domain-containing protein DDB_G0272472-like n=1 Tax=Hydractinia symbiolongicarpus TaxID=13093 RepID=UPI0025516037|nr:calponin homology domain-containing protein DDB_G0272472-like [Hydractinia symbiolongicarpus]